MSERSPKLVRNSQSSARSRALEDRAKTKIYRSYQIENTIRLLNKIEENDSYSISRGAMKTRLSLPSVSHRSSTPSHYPNDILEVP